MLVRNEYVLNVRTLDFNDMGYNLKRDGWLNNFVDAKNQWMREDGVPCRGAREKHPKFFSIIFFVLTNKNNIIMDWQCGICMFFISLFFFFLTCYFFFICSIFHSFSYPHLCAFGYSRRFRSLHAAPFNTILWRWSRTSTPTSSSSSSCVSPSKNTPLSTWPHNRGWFFSSSLEDGEAQFWFVVCVSSFLASILLDCLHLYLLDSQFFGMD